MESVSNASITNDRDDITDPRTSISLSHWHRCHDADRVDFMQDWWGNTQAFSTPDTPHIITIRQYNTGLLPIHRTNWMMLVRQEYVDMYDRMERAESSRDRNKGAIITGTPGTGLMYFAFYVLLRRLALKQPTVFTTGYGATLWFDATGMYQFDTRIDLASRCPIFLPFAQNAQIWSIFENPRVAKPIAETPYESNSVSVFNAIIGPPNVMRYKVLPEIWGAVWIMNPWTVTELAELMRRPSMLRCGPSRIGPSPEMAAEHLHSLLGGVPRSIIIHLSDPKLIEMCFGMHITSFGRVTNIEQVSEEDWFHRFALIRRRHQNMETLEGDDFLVGPRGTIFFEHLVERLDRYEERDLQQLKTVLTTAGKRYAALRSFMFKALAIFDLSRSNTSVLYHFAPMDSNRNNGTLYFTYSTTPVTAYPLPHTPTISSLPLSRRTPLAYDTNTSEPIVVDPSKFYYSTKFPPFNPLIDAFFFRCHPEGARPRSWKTVELFVLHLSTDCQNHGVPRVDGFLTVAALCDQVRRKCPKAAVKIYYILVVTCARRGQKLWDVRLDMDLAFDDAPGEVYVQYVHPA